MGTTIIQLVIAGIIVEILLSVPALKKRLPKTEIHAPAWVARNALIRHPWVSAPATAQVVR
jgi:hypothetical protein